MSTGNRRRRSILKSSSRNSIAPETEGRIEVEDLVEGTGNEKDTEGSYGNKACSASTTNTVGINLLSNAARKRVSFGRHQIKEFDVVQISPKISSADMTVRGEVDMEMSSEEDEGGFNTTHLDLDVENVSPETARTIDRTRYGGCMSMVDETMLNKTHTLFSIPVQDRVENGNAGIVNKTVWGGLMGVEDNLNQTYAILPMNPPKNEDHTIYGGAIEGLEGTLLNQTYVKPTIDCEPEHTIPSNHVDSVADNNNYIRPVSVNPESSIAKPLKVFFPTDEQQRKDLFPVKRSRKEIKKPNLFGVKTPKRKFVEVPNANSPSRVHSPAPKKVVSQAVKVEKSRFSAAAQTSFAFESGVDAQTSPFVFARQGTDFEIDTPSQKQNCQSTSCSSQDFFDRSISPLRSEIQSTEHEEATSPTHVAMISTRMDNVTLSNSSPQQKFIFDDFQNPTTPPPSGRKSRNSSSPIPLSEQSLVHLSTSTEDLSASPDPHEEYSLADPPPAAVPIPHVEQSLANLSIHEPQPPPPTSPAPHVEESLANLSIHEPTPVSLHLSDDLDFFVKNSSEMDTSEWITMGRCVRVELVRMAEPTWVKFLAKHGHVFNRIQNYVDTIVEQREIYKQFGFPAPPQ